MIDVSIIIPTYNRLWSLPKAISSCYETNLAIEVIVIDDGSTDGSSKWLSDRSDIILLQQKNSGKDWAVNKGFEIAKGKYIRFLDSDDWLLPYGTDALFKEAESKNLDLVTAGYSVYQENGKLMRDINWIECDDLIAQQLGECDSSHYSAFLFKKSFILDIPHRQDYYSRDDRKFILEVVLKKPKHHFVSKLTLGHQMHQLERLQTSKGLLEIVNNFALLKVYQTTLKELENLGECSNRRKNAAIKFIWPLATWIAKKNVKEASDIVKWIKELNPDFKIANPGILGFFYRFFGFKFTSYLLNFGRFFFSR